MLPAGLGIVCASQKALAQYDQAKLPRCFFDFGDMRKANATGYFPYTPSLPHAVRPARVARRCCFEEGLENVFARHHRLAEGTRAAVKAWGLELCARAPKWHSDTVSAIMVPAGVNGAEVIDVAYRRYNLALGAGLARMAGRLFRIGHLGDLNELHAARRASPARRWRCATWGSRSRRAAASARRRSTGAARRSRSRSASCRRARPTPSPAAAAAKEKATAGAAR